MQQEGDGACLELYLVSLLTVRQSSGHNMYGFDSSCSSAEGIAVGDGQLSFFGYSFSYRIVCRKPTTSLRKNIRRKTIKM